MTAAPDNAEYRSRRAALLECMAPDSIALVPGGAVFTALHGLPPTRFRQSSDFWYLTGLGEPGALLLLTRARDGNDQALLFCAERHARAELYTGERLGPERAAAALGLDLALPQSLLNQQMPARIANASTVYCDSGAHTDLAARLSAWIGQAAASGLAPGADLRPLAPLLHALRLHKSAAEIQLLRRAGEITAEGHRQAMRHCASARTEADLEAELRRAFLRGGAEDVAYPPIVAAGANACVLHYDTNRSALCADDLVLIDAGCEYHRYAADLTRTFPVSGRFTAEQRALYEVVLTAQKAALAECKPGVSLDAPNDLAIAIMLEGLAELGLYQPSDLADDPGDAAADDLLSTFCPHRCSHWLGLDVHDCPGADQEQTLQPGMTLTMEPGLYIPHNLDAAPPKWRGIGIRIEDDVLITRTGAEVMTASAPKEVAEIESLMAGA